MQTNETPITAVLNPIFDVIAEDRQKIKALETENEQLRTENHRLLELANEYIQKCDKLEADQAITVTLKPPIRPARFK